MNMNSSVFRSVSLLAFGLAALSASAAGTNYHVTDIGSFGGQSVTATSINNAGQVVGYGQDASHHIKSYIYQGGVMTNMGSLSTTQDIYAMQINESGTAAGYGYVPFAQGQIHAFTYAGGTKTQLSGTGTRSGAVALNDNGQVLGTLQVGAGPNQTVVWTSGVATVQAGLSGTANGINNAGQIAGYRSTGGGFGAYVYSAGVTSNIPTLGGTSNVTAAINNAGQVVGQSTLAGNTNTHAFLYSGGVAKDLGALNPTDFSYANGLNEFGKVVGTSSTQAGVYSAFYYDGTSMINLNQHLDASSVGWTLSEATSINDLGQIVGYGMIGGQQHAFLLTPLAAPEPGTFAALGLGALVVLKRRRKA